jgi:hypothetical protein
MCLIEEFPQFESRPEPADGDYCRPTHGPDFLAFNRRNLST